MIYAKDTLAKHTIASSLTIRAFVHNETHTSAAFDLQEVLLAIEAHYGPWHGEAWFNIQLYQWHRSSRLSFPLNAIVSAPSFGTSVSLHELQVINGPASPPL
jgi:hypothetical protein